MLLYKNAIEFLIKNFQELETYYNTDKDYYMDLPYVFYESVFTTYIIKMIDTDSKMNFARAFNFIETVLIEGDEKFKNLVEVAVIEALFFEGIFYNKEPAWDLLGELSKKSVRKCSEKNSN